MMNWIAKAAAAALLGLSLAGCQVGTVTPAPMVTPAAQATQTVQPAEPTAPAHTVTPTPPPGRLVLFSPPGAQNPALEKYVSGEAARAGLGLDVRAALAAQDLSGDVRVVIALTQPANLEELLTAAPQAQFAVVSAAGLEPGERLSVIRAQPEQLAFAAGFTAVLLVDDWRAAGLIANDAPNLQDAFRNGAGYFCGDCAPGWPQNTRFPLFSDVSAAADGAAWAGAADQLFDSGKAVVFYISPEAAREEVYAALAGKAQIDGSLKLIGSGAPPDSLQGQWAASVSIDPLPALQSALPELLAGKSAGALDAPVQLLNVNPNLLSAGRLDLIKEMLADLASGQINPLSVP